MQQIDMHFNPHDISKYRTQLMGLATLLIIFGHSAGNGVVMPGWLESLCGLASVGVDIFLLVSGFGLWYSLNKTQSGESIKYWYIRRYKRILIPYLLIIGFQNILAIQHGTSVLDALLEVSTISYWLNHRGAWFIAMLIPLYALTPIHYKIFNKVDNPNIYTIVLIILVTILSTLNFSIASAGGEMIVKNVKHVLCHIPAFLIGFMLAPYSQSGKTFSSFWIIVLPTIICLVMKLTNFGFWPGFLELPFIYISLCLIKFSGQCVNSILIFFGRISLESYLFNGILGSWIVWYLPQLYYSSLNKGCYISYILICVFGTFFSFLVNRLCEQFLNKPLIKND